MTARRCGSCNYTDVYYKEFITDDLDLMRATATEAETERFTLRPGDVLITKDSESWDDIAVPARRQRRSWTTWCAGTT